MIEQNIKKIKTKEFFRKFGVYIIIGVSLILFATLVILASVSDSKSEKPNVNVPVNSTVITFTNPLLNSTIYKDYNDKTLVFNETLNQWESHMCLDLLATSTTSVCAIYDGIVKNVYTNYLEGTVVEIEHANGLVSKYASLDEDVKVEEGDKVESGDEIGNASASANAQQNIGNYLQLTIFDENGNKVNPSNYLSFSNK